MNIPVGPITGSYINTLRDNLNPVLQAFLSKAPNEAVGLATYLTYSFPEILKTESIIDLFTDLSPDDQNRLKIVLAQISKSKDLKSKLVELTTHLIIHKRLSADDVRAFIREG